MLHKPVCLREMHLLNGAARLLLGGEKFAVARLALFDALAQRRELVGCLDGLFLVLR